jgi:hypothetical protein
MTRLRVRLTRPLEPSANIAACIGEDADGRRWAWFALGAESDLAPGSELEVPPDRRLGCPAHIADEQALAVLRDWPVWRLTRLAQLELGSGLLVAGDDWLARRVLGVCRLWGCLWRALFGASELRHAADHWIDPHTRAAESLLRSLPARPDAAIVLSGDHARLSLALAVCRDRATVVVALPEAMRVDLDLYPDAHRRGLRLVACQPFGGASAGQEWTDDAARILALRAKGLLAES